MAMTSKCTTGGSTTTQTSSTSSAATAVAAAASSSSHGSDGVNAGGMFSGWSRIYHVQAQVHSFYGHLTLSVQRAVAAATSTAI
jgi:hypothetical protein